MICEEIIVLKAFSDIFVGIRVDNAGSPLFTRMFVVNISSLKV